MLYVPHNLKFQQCGKPVNHLKEEGQIEGLMQKRCNSIVLPMVLCLHWAKDIL